MTNNEMVFLKDMPNKKITVVKTFAAPLNKIWKAWTESEILDEWWAPKPYRAETKQMDFRVGGSWLYCMAGPDGYNSWCKENYKTIDFHKSITNSVSFCDEAGNENTDSPTMYWKKEFREAANGTILTIEITFDKEADMEMIIKMGFQEGFTAGLNNLDQLI